jgi:dTDP-glucose pyrophosphorylase
LSNFDNRFCLVLDKNKRFKGTLTDGDIRRGLLKGLDSKCKVSDYSRKKNVVTFRRLNKKEIEVITKRKAINFIPYLSGKKKIINIYIKSSNKNLDFLPNKMLIMAGGKGLRLRPLTDKIPKPLLLVNNKPIIENIILNAKKNGINKFLISINYLGEKIKKFLRDGSQYGVKIDYIREKTPLGTAGSIRLIKKFSEPIIVSNSDIISNIKYKEMISYHKKNKSILTVSAKIINRTIDYGNLITKGNKILGIYEKPEKEIKINAGIYIISNKIKKFIKKNTYLDMTELINKLIKKNLRVNVFPLHESWTDYGLKKNIIKYQK